MKYPKTLSLVLVVAAAFTAYVAAGTASATTLERNAVKQNKSVAFSMSLKAGTSLAFTTTAGMVIDTCTQSETNGDTVADAGGGYSGTSLNTFLAEYFFGKCGGGVTVDERGTLSISWTKGTNGTVKSTGAVITVFFSAVKATIKCKTNGTHIGTIVGTAGGQADFEVNAVLDCGFLSPSTKMVGSYVFTSPDGLGVTE